MANTSATFPGTIVDDSSVGTVTWSNPTNAGANDGSTATVMSGMSGTETGYGAQLILGGTPTGSKYTSTLDGTLRAGTYGGATDKWGCTLTDTVVNGSTFGVGYQSTGPAGTSHRLKATNFGFAIPSGATIDGVAVVIERQLTGALPLYNNVDYITVQIYYTEAVTDNTWSGATDNNWSTATNWSLGHKPAVTEKVIMANGVSCVVDEATAALESFDMTGYSGTLSGSNNITITNAADAVCKFAGTVTWTGQLLLNPATTKILSLTAAEKLTACTGITLNGAGTVTLIDALSIPATTIITHTTGTFKTDGAADNSGLSHSWGKYTTAAGTKILTLGNSTITITGTGTPWNYSTTSATLNEGTSIIILSGSDVTWGGGTETYYDIRLTGSGAVTLAGSPTITNLTRTGTAIQLNSLVLSGSNTTVNGSLTLTGNSSINRLLISSVIFGTSRTITLGGSATCASNSSYVDFQDTNLTGGAANERNLSAITGLSGDCGGNTGITFTDSATQTWNGTTGNWSTLSFWTSRIPLPQDDVIIPDPGAAGRTLTINMVRICKNLTVTNNNAANKPTLSLTATIFSIYGSLTLVSPTYMTLTQTYTLKFEGRGSTYYLTSAGNTFSRSIYINMATETMVFADDLTITTYALALFSGNISTSHAVTAGFISFDGAGTVTMGDSTWTVTNQNSGVYTWTNSNCNIIAGNSTIALTYTGVTSYGFIGGTATYNNIVVTPGSGVLTFSGAFTANNITMSEGGTKTIKFVKNTTYTLTGNNFLSGTAGNLITIDNNDASATNFTLNFTGSGDVAVDYIKINHSTATPGSTWYAGTHSTDDGANTGWTFTDAPAGGAIGWVVSLLTSQPIVNNSIIVR